MSRIYTKWKCKKCKHKFSKYVSFGHPDKDFVFEWVCGHCGYINKLKVKAMPHHWWDYCL